MSNGWIKVHRSLIDNPKRVRSSRLALWLYILLSVNHTPQKTFFGGKETTLNPGEGLFSTPDLARKLCEPISVIRRSLEWFESEQQIEQRKTNQGTVSTVLNWDKYQQSEQRDEQQVNNERTTSEQRVNNLPYYKKNEECKNEECNINNTNVLYVHPADDEPQKQGEYQTIVDAWNSLPVKNILAIRGKRLDMLRARIKEYGYDDVLHAISMIRNAPFLLGQNKQGWQITFDWFVKPNNFPKVLEGNYDSRTNSMPSGKNDMQAGFNEAMRILNLEVNDG